MNPEGNQNAPAAAAQAPQNDLPLQVLTEQFTRLEAELRAAGAHNRVGTFSGEGNGAQFTQWMKEMERVRIALKADDERMKFIALQTLSGQAADFATGLIKTDAQLTWDRLYAQLRERYSDLADVLFARQRLKRLKQKKVESVQNFFQRIISLADESYPGQNLANNVIQEQLIEIFVDGLLDNNMAKRLIRARPQNTAAALHMATQEQQATRAYELRRGETPMEVDNVRSQGGTDSHRLSARQ